MVKHIFLVGFMGAGKTTIGAALQALTGMTLLDTDQQIAESEGKAVSLIFDEFGEAHFRHLEKQLLQQLSLSNEPCIFSTGGGMFADLENRQLMGLVGTTFTSRKVFVSYTRRSDMITPAHWLLRQLKRTVLTFQKKKKVLSKSRFYHSQFWVSISSCS